MKHFILTIILISGFLPYATAAQLDATIRANDEVIKPTFQFLRVVYIEYPERGEISEELQGIKQKISFSASSETPGMREIISKINRNLESIQSSAIVVDAKMDYNATIQGHEDYAVIEYKVQLIPTITNHVISRTGDKSMIDANWRGIWVETPITIESPYGFIDINNPRTLLDIASPKVSEKLKEADILEIPLVDATGIQNLSLGIWHSLFDNTAIIQGSKEWNYTGYLSTHYSMGECNIGIGQCNDKEWIQDIELDKKYTIRVIESRDDATIAIEGYADYSNFKGVEIFETNLKERITQKPDTDEFPATVMYGMAGMAVIGAVIMFVISDRKIKKDKDEGQTGIDPSHLIAYDTSLSAGGYKTNRGESYIADKNARTPV